MNGNQLLYYVFRVYSVLSILIYICYIFYIHYFHIPYSIVSLSFVLFPFILFVLLQWIVSKKTSVLKGSRSIKVTLVIVSFLTFYCIGILGLNEFHAKFTTHKWVKKPEERVYMVDDLLDKHGLVHKTRDEIIELLGYPTETEYFKTENNVVYYLGDERGLIRIDSEWLIIFFNNSDKVTRYEIRTD